MFMNDKMPRMTISLTKEQEKKLKEVCPNTIIFVDEPYMAAYGSIGFMLSKEKVISYLEEVFQGISGLKGSHCCGNTDCIYTVGALAHECVTDNHHTHSG